MGLTAAQKRIVEADERLRNAEREAHKLIIETDLRMRELERSAAVGGVDDRTRYRQELRRSLGLEQVEAVRCLAIYKECTSGDFPDSHALIYVANEQLAHFATSMLEHFNANIIWYNNHESCARWGSKKAIAELDDVLLSMDEVSDKIEEFVEDE